MIRKVRLARPSFTNADIAAYGRDVRLILKSGRLTSGNYVKSFEDGFREVIGTKFSLAMNSCTAVLHAMTASLDLRPRDEVVVPANTFVSTANAVFYTGAIPALADCDPETYNVRAEDIELALTPRTKAVIVTHLAGNPCEMDEIEELCRQKGLILFEDAAHAVGSTYKGRLCGSFGSGGAFSFYPSKVLTSAEGGMLTTDSKDLFDFSWLFRNVGRQGMGHGPIVTLACNYRMSELHAALGLNQLGHLNAFLKKRTHLASLYRERLQGIDWLEPQRVHGHSASSYYAFIVRTLPNRPMSRDKLLAFLADKGVETTVMFKPVHSQPYFAQRVKRMPHLPNSESIGEDSLALPLHTGLSSEDVEYVVQVLKSAS